MPLAKPCRFGFGVMAISRVSIERLIISTAIENHEMRFFRMSSVCDNDVPLADCFCTHFGFSRSLRDAMLLIQIPLEPRKHLTNFVSLAKIGDRVGEGVVVFEL